MRRLSPSYDDKERWIERPNSDSVRWPQVLLLFCPLGGYSSESFERVCQILSIIQGTEIANFNRVWYNSNNIHWIVCKRSNGMVRENERRSECDGRKESASIQKL